MKDKGEYTALDIEDARNYKVVKANQIIQKARYDLSLIELKVLAFVLSKVKPSDTEFKTYSFSIKEYCSVCGIDSDNGGNYDYIKKTLKALRDKSFWMLDEHGDEVTVSWLQKVRIVKRSGKIEVRLDDDLQKYILGLFSNYTQYQLISILPMKHAYSVRMYELLKSYAWQEGALLDVEKLKETLQCKYYTNFKDFRRTVIETAVEEINRYTDLEVSWEPIRKGKRVEKLRFEIRKQNMYERYDNYHAALHELDGEPEQMSFADIMKG